jgi:hypothetical protein
MQRQLVLAGGFVVDGGHGRRLDERADALGFEDLRGYLRDRCDAGYGLPRIATELGIGDWQVQAALARSGVRLASRPDRLARQRRRYTEERIAARVAALGFADVGAYQYSVRWVRLMDATMPLTVGVCAGTPGTRRPNTPAGIAARAMPGRWSGRRNRFGCGSLVGTG